MGWVAAPQAAPTVTNVLETGTAPATGPSSTRHHRIARTRGEDDIITEVDGAIRAGAPSKEPELGSDLIVIEGAVRNQPTSITAATRGRASVGGDPAQVVVDHHVVDLKIRPSDHEGIGLRHIIDESIANDGTSYRIRDLRIVNLAPNNVRAVNDVMDDKVLHEGIVAFEIAAVPSDFGPTHIRVVDREIPHRETVQVGASKDTMLPTVMHLDVIYNDAASQRT